MLWQPITKECRHLASVAGLYPNRSKKRAFLTVLRSEVFLPVSPSYGCFCIAAIMSNFSQQANSSKVNVKGLRKVKRELTSALYEIRAISLRNETKVHNH